MLRRQDSRQSYERRPSFVLCMFYLLVVRTHLKLFGFGRTISLVQRLTDRVRPKVAGASDLVSDAARSVATAAAFFPGRAICLEQSLVLYFVLCRRGVAAELRIGAKPYPFKAHAWVEYGGVAVAEEPEWIAQLLPFPQVGR